MQNLQDSGDSLNRNAEGYADYTAGEACGNYYREQMEQKRRQEWFDKQAMKNLASFVRRFMDLMGYELVNITYRDPESGQEWKKH